MAAIRRKVAAVAWLDVATMTGPFVGLALPAGGPAPKSHLYLRISRLLI